MDPEIFFPPIQIPLTIYVHKHRPLGYVLYIKPPPPIITTDPLDKFCMPVFVLQQVLLNVGIRMTQT